MQYELSLFSRVLYFLKSHSLQGDIGKGNGDVEGVKYLGHGDPGSPTWYFMGEQLLSHLVLFTGLKVPSRYESALHLYNM